MIESSRGLIQRFGKSTWLPLCVMLFPVIGHAQCGSRGDECQSLAEFDGVPITASAPSLLPGQSPGKKFTPALTNPWASTYGAIVWHEGWYGNEAQTLEVTEGLFDLKSNRVILRGRWGRKENSAKHGSFEFEFLSPCEFTGSWWYSGMDRRVPWVGRCAGNVTNGQSSSSVGGDG